MNKLLLMIVSFRNVYIKVQLRFCRRSQGKYAAKDDHYSLLLSMHAIKYFIQKK